MTNAVPSEHRTSPPVNLQQAQLPGLLRAVGEEIQAGALITVPYSKNLPPDGFDSLRPGNLTVVEEHLEQVFLPPTVRDRLGLIHIEDREFEIVERGEAALYREDRTADAEQGLPKEVNHLTRALADTGVRHALAHTILLPGRGSEQFTRRMAALLGVETAPVTHLRFPSRESFARIDRSVRGLDAVVVQQIVGDTDVALASAELLINAASRASVESIILVIPYLPAQRQDRRGAERTAVSPTTLFSRLEAAGRGRLQSVITVDMHTLQAEGMSGRINVDNLSGAALMLPRLRELIGEREVAVVFPDAGARKRAQEDGLERKIVRIWDGRVRFGAMSKTRGEQKGTIAQSRFEGDPAILAGRPVICFDDMIDSGGTAFESIQMIWNYAPSELYYAADHALLTRLAVERFRALTVAGEAGARRAVDKLLVLNTVPLRRGRGDLIEVTDVICMLAHFVAGVVSRGNFSTRELAELYSGTLTQ